MSSFNAAPDSLTLYGVSFPGRLLFGHPRRYPSPKVLEESVRAARPAMLTVSLRRQAAGHNEIGGQAFWDLLAQLDIPFLPNTAGCHTPEEVFTTAMMAREVFGHKWIKLELIGNDYTLQPDTLNMVGAAERLLREGFKVLPYCTEDSTPVPLRVVFLAMITPLKSSGYYRQRNSRIIAGLFVPPRNP